MIEIKNLTKKYEEIIAVNDLSLEIESGELFGLLGPNGAGKTTALNLMSTFIRPDNGKISINNIDILTNPGQVKPLIGFIPQEISLYSDLTVEENLNFWGKIYKMSRSSLKSRREDLLKTVGLWDRRKTLISKLSGGMKRRINIATGIIHNPQIIFMDEPTVGVDPQSRLFIYSMIEDLHKAGKTIIYTTHYMEEAERLCTRIGIIDKGKIIALGSKEELLSQLDGERTITLHLEKPYFDNPDLPQSLFKVDHNNPQKITIHPKEIGRDLSEIIKTLESSDNKIDNIDSNMPCLEDLFIKLTGRELRE